MGRYYRLSKKITEEQAENILEELKAVEGMESVQFVDDFSKLKVSTQEDMYGTVMAKTVNICSRIAKGVEISFCGFAQEV